MIFFLVIVKKYLLQSILLCFRKFKIQKTSLQTAITSTERREIKCMRKKKQQQIKIKKKQFKNKKVSKVATPH